MSPQSRTDDPGRRLLLIAPLAVFMLVAAAASIRQLDYIVGASLGLVIIFYAARRPDLGILGLVIFLPFQTLIYSLLFTIGIAGNVVRQAGSWKEGLGVGIAIAGVRGFRAARKHLDLLDMLGLAFVGLALLYAIVPQLFTDGAPSASNVRSLAFRQSAAFVLLLLGARHAILPPNFGRRVAKAVMAVGAIVATVAIYEFFLSDSWNRFVVETLQYPRYSFEVLNIGNPFTTDIRFYGSLGGEKFTRVGSTLLSPLSLGFYLLLPFAFAVERTVRDGLRSAAGAVLILTGTALIFTQTRAGIVGALVIAFVAVRATPGKSTDRRLQYGFILTIVIALAMPVAVVSGLAERSTSAAAGDEQSALDHWDAQVNGVQGVIDNPLGAGLGTSAGVGQRFSSTGAFITEDYYLQVGIEMGVIGMFLFIALTLVLIRRMSWATRQVDDLPLGAMRAAIIGLAIGAALLHTWTDFPVAWSAWVLAGATLGLAERRIRDDEAGAPATSDLVVGPPTRH